jgi:hypothetical protein
MVAEPCGKNQVGAGQLAAVKIAYLILCHKSPEHVIRLISRLRAEGSFFVVHIDKKAGPPVSDVLQSFSAHSPDVVLAKRVRCYWGSFSLVQATINCIDAAISSKRPFDYAMLVSGQDYPLKPAQAIQRFLANNMGREFIETFRLDKPNKWTTHEQFYNAMNRVQYYTFFIIRSRHFHLKVKRRFPFGWSPYGGSQWWCLTHECISYIRQFLLDNPSYVRYFKRVFIPDETMFQSLVANSSFAEHNFGADLRYIDWTNPNPTCPRILDQSDFDRLRNSPNLIARKFDIDKSHELLNNIDKFISETK